MDANSRGQEVEDTGPETTLVKQQSVRDDDWLADKWSKGPKRIADTSFDKISLVFVVSALSAGLSFLFVFGVQAALPSTIAIVTSVFTFLSVRESKRDREASVAPTLFVGKRQEKYGILNLGNGPAHDLSVTVSKTQSTNWDATESEFDSEILRADDDFLPLKTESEPNYVHFEYRSNVGYKEYNVTREVLPNND